MDGGDWKFRNLWLNFICNIVGNVDWWVGLDLLYMHYIHVGDICRIIIRRIWFRFSVLVTEANSTLISGTGFCSKRNCYFSYLCASNFFCFGLLLFFWNHRTYWRGNYGCMWDWYDWIHSQVNDGKSFSWTIKEQQVFKARRKFSKERLLLHTNSSPYQAQRN